MPHPRFAGTSSPRLGYVDLSKTLVIAGEVLAEADNHIMSFPLAASWRWCSQCTPIIGRKSQHSSRLFSASKQGTLGFTRNLIGQRHATSATQRHGTPFIRNRTRLPFIIIRIPGEPLKMNRSLVARDVNLPWFVGCSVLTHCHTTALGVAQGWPRLHLVGCDYMMSQVKKHVFSKWII